MYKPVLFPYYSYEDAFLWVAPNGALERGRYRPLESRTDGFLTPSESGDEVPPLVSSQGSAAASVDVAGRVAGFLDGNADLFGHGSEALKSARVVRQYTTQRNGLRSVAWEQMLDGIPVAEAVLYGHVTLKGELVCLGSQFLPNVERAADAGVANRAAIERDPAIAAQRAVASAASCIGEPLLEDSVSVVEALCRS